MALITSFCQQPFLLCMLFFYGVFLIDSGAGIALPTELRARILQGNISNNESHPYLVSIQRLYHRDALNSFYIPFCGGVLLDHRTIITAAHCFDHKPACWMQNSHDCYRIIAGEYNLTHQDSLREQITTFSPNAIDVHEDYDGFHYDNDIALIHLDKPLKYSKYVKRIRLVEPSIKYQETGVIAGWGSTLDEMQSKILREATVTIFSDEYCINQWGDDFHPEEMLCAGSNIGSNPDSDLVADACFGDSGGPLVVRDSVRPHRRYLVGLISWGYECGYKEYPGLYVRVQSYLKWISEKRLERLVELSSKMRQNYIITK